MEFIKMHGAGNDFVIVKSENPSFDTALVTQISDRHFGVGCDQFVVMRSITQSSCIMDIYNQDGSRSNACGNATRCVAYLIGARESTIYVGDRALRASVDGHYVSVEMGGYEIAPEDWLINGYKGRYINVGNPHFVIFVDDIDNFDVAAIAPSIQYDKAFPEGVNVNFAQIVSNSKIKLRVFERGAGETLSCGTGSCATSVVAHTTKGLADDIEVSLKGGVIDVKIRDAKMTMGGLVTEVFKGLW